ncbi:stalk domain-containing protein [Evansella sp. AB-rgal1]|uniref:stalk domain-containing protein n=1 Tax=Evansella sp. AB-rgal1 TaxID=3242696 RepID=UPI00359E9D0D
MHKNLFYLFLLLFFSFIALVPSVTASESTKQESEVTINNKAMYGYIENGRTLIPVRYVSEALGMEVLYDAKTKDITIKNDEDILKLNVNSTTGNINGLPFKMDVQPRLIQGRTYIPLRFVLENLSIPFQYHEDTSKIVVNNDNVSFTVDIKPITSAYLYRPEKIYSIMYHEFGDNPSSLYVPLGTFREQLEMLIQQGYETITDQDVINYKNNPSYRLPKKPLLLTIDDGYLSNYTDVYPILKEYGLRANIYLISKSHPIRFTLEQAREMEDSRVINIQDHTYEHHRRTDGVNLAGIPVSGGPLLTTIKTGETRQDYIHRIRDDLKKSKEVLENALGKKVNVLAFPFGAYNHEVLKVTRELGYELLITTEPGYNTYESLQTGLVKRINVRGEYTSEDLKRELNR